MLLIIFQNHSAIKFLYIVNCKRTHGLISCYRWFDYLGTLFVGVETPTYKLTKDFFSNPKNFVDKMNKSASIHSPEECVGAYTEMIQIHNGNSRTTNPKLRKIY